MGFGVMLATLAATVTVNVLLLGYGGTPNDPVGRLSPIAYLPSPLPQPQARGREPAAARPRRLTGARASADALLGERGQVMRAAGTSL